MELSRSPFYVFDLDERASLMSFVWTERSVAMDADDYKDAIRAYARLVLQHRARRALVDLRSFRYRPEDAHLLASWWADEIVPLYNEAGLQKLAFVIPDSEQARDETPVEAQAGENFLTRQFASEQAGIAWLTADP